MRRKHVLRYGALLAALLVAGRALPQAPFALDTTFRMNVQSRSVSSVLPLPDGKVLASGVMRFPGESFDRALVRLHPDGSRDLSFYDFAVGAGRITPWEGKLYVGRTQIVSRILMNGQFDPTWAEMNTTPYFSSLQGGDYHVFPDGRLVMSGAHTLNDPVRGFTGLHQFIWFTNTGYLDTTRVHRKANAVLYEFEELPDGKFIVSGLASVFEGRPVGRVFRLHADGSLDTTFQTGVDWGEARAYVPLDDGRVYAGGYFRLQNAPQDTLRLVRFLPDGSLDPSFTSPNFGLGALPNYNYLGARIHGVSPWPGRRLVVTGRFQTVNGHERRGICMLDSTGALLTAFDGQGIWPYVFMPGTPQEYVFADMSGIVSYDATRYLVWGAYRGYGDGEMTDMQQRFVSRLFAGDITTEVVPQEQARDPAFRVHPNPASGWVRVEYTLADGKAQGIMRLRDMMGRELAVRPLSEGTGIVLDIGGLMPGLYAVEVRVNGRVEHVEKLIVQ